jgi:hypothetical protein
MIKKNQSSKKEYGSAVFDWYGLTNKEILTKMSIFLSEKVHHHHHHHPRTKTLT